MRNLFLTGASGFIGQEFLSYINQNYPGNTYCLIRNHKSEWINPYLGERIKIVHGDILYPASYLAELSNCDTVIHLAAATGKQPNTDIYFDINVTGTERLLQACKQAAIKKINFISTIAVNYPNLDHYPYAKSKAEAERLVTESGIPYTILRPTIVLGEGSPAWINFEKLASRKAILLIGNGKTRIQPILVKDLVRLIYESSSPDKFINQLIDCGGNEIILVERFLQLIHFTYFKREAPIIKVPASVLIRTIKILERFLPTKIPLNPGQLSVFLYDSTVNQANIIENSRASLRGVNQIIDNLIEQKTTQKEIESLRNESVIFSRYLINQQPGVQVINHYIKAHIESDLFRNEDFRGINGILYKIGRKNILFSNLADAYAGLFCKKTILRKKLILLLALLEFDRFSFREFESPSSNNLFVWLTGLLFSGIVSAIFILISIPLFLPFHLLGKLYPGKGIIHR